MKTEQDLRDKLGELEKRMERAKPIGVAGQPTLSKALTSRVVELERKLATMNELFEQYLQRVEERLAQLENDVNG